MSTAALELPTDPLAKGWMDAIETAWRLAYAERMNELKGRWPKRFDARGLHPYSEVWGRIAILAALAGVHVEGFDPVALRSEARTAAEADFRQEVLDAG